ncbi:unnamed protein product [Vicia faba]|uniref:Leucine-rich repeat-containing N-terminal plant-type domain-containing protein n=1 Tax=Vicia faba TaxID=3906 RepID=A0AAV0YCU1_VICFA|nr:unnamed protein product [Vicia faba]
MNKNLFLIIITITTLLPLNTNGAKCHPDDESGLLTLKSSIKFDPSSMLKTWITGTDCCTWSGVSCGDNKRVTTLSLTGDLENPKSYLSGTVPKSFANLTKIFNLDLSDNFLVDPFPSLNVKGIESLDLSRNMFHLNEIPKWVTSSPIIYSLKLAKCGIKMKLDDWKPSETYFYDFIDLSGNEISGSAVGLLNETEYLVGFWSSENVLKFDLGSLRFGDRLKYLDLSHNMVFGKVTTSVVGIEKLNVSYNHLCGEIPKNNLSASVFVGNDCLCGSPLKPCKA